MSDLPAQRLAIYEPAFSYISGLFWSYHFKAKQKIRINSEQSKCYGVLFTCLTARVVHLEIAGNSSTDSFILALWRFIAPLGQSNITWSDNGTNFVGANRELKNILLELNQSEIISTLINQRIV